MMVNFGANGTYEWLVVSEEDISLLEVCPEIVLGKYVAVTSIDSGDYIPDEHEKTAGWYSRGEIAYSPQILKAEDVPRCLAPYDELYVFPHTVDLGTSHIGESVFEVPQAPDHVSVYVNYGEFAFDRPDELTELFWKQMEWIRPESYLANGTYLNFASLNKQLFASVRDAVTALARE